MLPCPQLISLAPFVIIFLIYICRRNRVGAGPLLSPSVLKIFVAFAIGGMLGDALLHLLPHAMDPHSHHAMTEPVDILAEIGRVTLPNIQVNAAFGVSAGMKQHHPSEMQERGHPNGGAHSHSHSHSHEHNHEQSHHAHTHAHSHDDALSHLNAGQTHGHAHSQDHAHLHETSLTKEHGGAKGSSHSHSHSHSQKSAEKPQVRGSAGGQSHSHSHDSYAHSEQGEHGLAHGHSHSHDGGGSGAHEHDHSAGLIVGLWTLAGMFTFFIIEKTARAHSGGAGGHGHSHGHAHGKASAAAEVHSDEDDADSSSVGLRQRTPQPSEAKKKRSKVVVKFDAPSVTADQYITGVLNLIGDFSHNFTDGMAIAASYLAGGSMGLSTTMAVLIHEVPHEIGDFAILLQSGFSVPAALKAQLLTAIGAIAGCLFGYWSGATGEDAQKSWIIPFTAGGFIYVACVNVLPTLLAHESLRQTVCEILAMGLGVSMMVVIALFFE